MFLSPGENFPALSLPGKENPFWSGYCSSISVSTLTHSHSTVCNGVRKKDINLSPITAAPLLPDNRSRNFFFTSYLVSMSVGVGRNLLPVGHDLIRGILGRNE